MSVFVVVLAAEHPDEDPWVIEHATEEADRQGHPLPPYQGLGTLPNGTRVHMYCDAETAFRARLQWSSAEEAAEVPGA